MLFFAFTFGYFNGSPREPRLAFAPETVYAETRVEAESNSLSAGIGPNFVPLVKKVRAAVVRVTAEAILERRSPLSGNDFFDRFFNVPERGRRERVSGMGSGFFISPDGYILTNNHLVEGAIKIKIKDIDNNEYDAKKIGVDPKTDLALLKADIKNSHYIQLGDSDKVEIGEWVLAIGNPLEQDLSVTAGIVSAKGRQLSGLDVDYQNFIQTDASINQGNSGGPLLNMEGKAIGINSVILSTSGGSIGIGFSIPSNMAKKVIDDLKKEGRVIRGYIGVQISEVAEADAGQLNLPTGGVLIMKVEEGTPAKKAGLQKYDLIVAIDGKEVKTAGELRNTIANYNPGDKIRVTIYRDKVKKVIDVQIEESPDSIKIKGDEAEKDTIDLGMVLTNNSSSIARELDLSTSEGIVVTQIDRDGLAYQNNIRAGDVIIGVNRTPISSVRQFREIIADKRNKTIFLSIIRGESETLLRFKIPE